MTIAQEIKHIQQDLLQGQKSPHLLAEYRVRLSGYYATLSELLAAILAEKPLLWNEMRPNYKSDTACDRALEATDKGIEEMRLKLRLKSLEKMMSSITTLINVANAEAKNQW